MFGGYTSGVPSRIEPPGTAATEFGFTYYADAFLFDYDGVAPTSSPGTKSTIEEVPADTESGLETAVEQLSLDSQVARTSSPSPSSGDEEEDEHSGDNDGPSSLASFAYPTWRHILTRGFPTYRCQASLLSDQATGKIYLYGGFVNSDLVPGRKSLTTRTFGDIFQLRLDIEGGDFSKVDIEEEGRTAKAGPWQRCFECGNAGRWRKCGGRCKGKAYFCSQECQKDGWKEHKRIHKCSKV